ncbi:MAG: PAS domain S-box protein [Bacillota bacterium]
MLEVTIDVTGQRRAEQLLRESERRYRSVVDTEDVIFTLENNGCITYISPAIERLSLYGTDEVTNKAFDCILHPDDRPGFADGIRRALDGHMQVCEFRIIIRTAQWPTRATVCPLVKDGEVAGVTGILTDISECKRAEDALRESEEKYRTIFETAGTAMLMVEKDGIISLANTEFERLSGYLKEKLEGKRRWTEFVAPEDVERLMEYHLLRHRRPESAPRDYEFAFVTRDGKRRDVFATVSIIPGTERTVASFSNVTKRNQAKPELQKSERQYRLLAQNVRDVIWAVDMNLRCTYLSPSVAHLLGCSVEEAMAATLDMLTPVSRKIATRVFSEELAREAALENDLTRSRTLELEFVRRAAPQPGPRSI